MKANGFQGNGQVTEQEKALITACVNGDKAAWDEFVR
jgi:hypothetical protein